MITPTPKCVFCKHYHEFANFNKLTCNAFPSGIPEKIIDGEFEHTKKYPRQRNSILFEPKENDLSKTLLDRMATGGITIIKNDGSKIRIDFARGFKSK